MDHTLMDPLATSNIDSNSNTDTNSNTNSGNSSIYRRGGAAASSSSSSSSSFVSRHRKVLDRIAVDSTESRRYAVPNNNATPPPSSTPLRISGSSHGNSDSANGGSRAESRRRTTTAGSVVYKFCARLLVCGKRAVTTSPIKTCDDVTLSLLPLYKWLKVYEWKRTLPKDLVAGLTVGVMIIPQSMSYAKLAGLPVEYGLYSALVPVYAYAMFGSSRQLAVGPVAIISLLLSTGLVNLLSRHGIAKDNDANYQALYNQLAIQTSFLVGVTNIAMGLLRMGFVTIFLCTS
jgi:Sulfate permease family